MYNEAGLTIEKPFSKRKSFFYLGDGYIFFGFHLLAKKLFLLLVQYFNGSYQLNIECK
jgi:hypothetical protein